MAGGRPTDYNQEIASKICFELSTGRSLKSICLEEGMPHFVTVLRWVMKHEEFRNQYAQAREIQAEVWAEEIVDISDDNTRDMKIVARGDELVEVLDSDHVQRSKLRVDARKWIVSKLLPKKYGDSQQVKLSNPDGGPVEVRSLTDEQLESRLTILLGKAGIIDSPRGENEEREET